MATVEVRLLASNAPHRADSSAQNASFRVDVWPMAGCRKCCVRALVLHVVANTLLDRRCVFVQQILVNAGALMPIDGFGRHTCHDLMGLFFLVEWEPI